MKFQITGNLYFLSSWFNHFITISVASSLLKEFIADQTMAFKFSLEERVFTLSAFGIKATRIPFVDFYKLKIMNFCNNSRIRCHLTIYSKAFLNNCLELSSFKSPTIHIVKKCNLLPKNFSNVLLLPKYFRLDNSVALKSELVNWAKPAISSTSLCGLPEVSIKTGSSVESIRWFNLFAN